MRKRMYRLSMLVVSVSVLALLGLSACDGTRTPNKLKGGTPILAGLDPIDVTVTGFVGGATTTSGASTSQARSSQRSRVVTNEGVEIPGANGDPLRDMGWNNLYTEGLSTTVLPATSTKTIQFFIAGSDEALTDPIEVNAGGLFNQTFDATRLRTGGNVELELSVDGEMSRIKLPVLNPRSRDYFGINVIRRAGGSLVVELFRDALDNDSGSLKEGSPDGVADNGYRIIVDNGTDVDGDGVPDTAARMDISDGFSFFDLNLDGLFGDPEFDSITYIDANDAGFADTPVFFADENLRESQPGALELSVVYNPEGDGIRRDDADDVARSRPAADSISELNLTLTPTEIAANGINIASVRVEVVPTAGRVPLNAVLNFSLTQEGGIPFELNGNARFVANQGQTNSRLLSPVDPQVRLFADGSFALTESFLVPNLERDSVTSSTQVLVDIGLDGRNAELPSLDQTLALRLLPNSAPALANVLIAGQNDISGVPGGLESVSEFARLVWGDPVQVEGEGFATNVADNVVVIGGVPVDNLSVNTDGTVLNFTIPQGAVSGPIAVVVGGLGGKTSQDLVIAGQPFSVIQVTPEISGGAITENATVSVQMSRDIDAGSVGSSALFIREVGGADLNWLVNLEGSDTLELMPTIGSTAMVAGTDYEVVLTSDLIAAGTNPALRFDADPASRFVDGVPQETQVIATFTAQAPDVTAPQVVSSVPADGESAAVAEDPIVVTFNEAISAASVQAAAASGSLSLTQTSSAEAVAFTASLNADGTQLTIAPTFFLTGGEEYVLRLPGTLADNLSDSAGNALDLQGATDAIEITFTIRMTIAFIEPRSGPPGTLVRLEGGNFGETIGDVSVTIGGVALETIDEVAPTEVLFSIPEDSAGGIILVTVGADTAVSPFPFTITRGLERVALPGVEGDQPVGLAISPDSSRLFQSNQAVGTIGVFDLNDLTQVDSDGNSENGITPIQVGNVPTEMKLTSGGRRLLTTDFGLSGAPGNSIYVINAEDSLGEPENESYSIEATVETGQRPTRIAIAPDETIWYVTNFLDDSLSVISAESPYQVLAVIPTGLGPNGIALSADGTEGVVCNYIEGTVTIFDAVSNEERGRVAVGLAPSRVVYTASGRFALVTCSGDATLHIVDTLNQQSIGFVDLPEEPTAVTFNRNRDRIFVCSRKLDIITEFSVVEDGETISITQEGLPIATDRVPSNITLTPDGSRLVVSCEGAGHSNVIFYEEPAATVYDIGFVGEGGQGGIAANYVEFANPRTPTRSTANTRFVDVGAQLALPGGGYNRNPNLNRVTFAGPPDAQGNPTRVEGIIDATQSTTQLLVITVPEGAVSGDMIVIVNSQATRPTPIVITPPVTQLERLTPADQARNVDANALLSAKFNEPVVATASDFELVRLLDTFTNGVRDVDTTPVTLALRGRNFDREFDITPGSTYTAQSNSNNYYRLTVYDTIVDLGNNNLDQSHTITFQLSDSRGPTLLQSYFADLDNNGPDQGDWMSLIFDEPISLPQGTAIPIGATGLDINLTQGNLGTGAVATAFPESFVTLFPAFRDLFARSALITLGAGADLTIPGANSGVSGLANNGGSGNQVTDKSGNTVLNLATATVDIQIVPVFIPAPEIVAARLTDQTTVNLIGEAGEVIELTATTPLTQLGAIDTSIFTLTGNGVYLGDSPTLELDSSDHKRLRITLGANAFFNFEDSDFTISMPADESDLQNYYGVSLRAFAGNTISYDVGTVTGGPKIDFEAEIPVAFIDKDNNGLDEGDVVALTMTRPILVGSNVTPSDLLTFGVPSDFFGTGATVRASTDPSLPPALRAKTIEIVLGVGPNMFAGTPNDVFIAGNTRVGDPSGFDINPNIPAGYVRDLLGNNAEPDSANGLFDLKSADQTAPTMIRAVGLDLHGDGVLGQGDSIVMSYNEGALINGATPADFLFRFGTQELSFGNNPALQVTTPTLIGGVRVPRSALQIILGQGANIPLEAGLSIEHRTGNPVTDLSGNPVVASQQVFLLIQLNGLPQLFGSLLHDPDLNGTDEGDIIYAVFEQPMKVQGGVVDAASVFQLSVAGDSFGANATARLATVTSDVINFGLSSRALGTVDPNIVEIQLGTNARLTGPHLVATPPEIQYTNPNQILVSTSGAAAGLRLKRPTALAFSLQNLQNAFDDPSRSGVSDRYDGIEFDLSGDGSANVTISFRLPGGGAFRNTDDTFNEIVGRINAAMIDQGKRTRARLNFQHRELVIYDNGEGYLGSGSILAAGDVANQVNGTYQVGINTALTNIVDQTARGQADIFSHSDGVRPVLQSALYDQAKNIIELTFSETVLVQNAATAAELFRLPVVGDSFGSGARVFGTANSNVIAIALRNDSLVTEPGTYSVNTAGSPSGIRVRSSVTAGQIADVSGLTPGSNNVDLVAGTAAPLRQLTLLQNITAPSQIPLDGSASVFFGVSFQKINPTASLIFDNLTLDYNGSATNASDVITQVSVYADSDSTGTLSAGDDLFTSGVFDGNNQFVVTDDNNLLNGITDPDQWPVLIVVVETVPDTAQDGETISMQVQTVNVSDFSTLSSVAVAGLPIVSGVSTLFDDGTIPELGAGDIDIQSVETGFNGRVGHSMVELERDRFSSMIVLSAASLAGLNAGATGGANDLDNVGIDLDGDRNANFPVSDSSIAYSGGIDTEAEIHAFANALESSLGSSGEVSVGADGSLVIKLRGESASGRPGGFVTGGDVGSNESFATVLPYQGNGWGVNGALIFGGEDSSGNLTNSVEIMSRSGSDTWTFTSLPTLGDPTAGSPSARRDAAMVITESGLVVMHGGRNATAVLNDTWTLEPAGLAGSDGLPSAMQWRQLATTGVTPPQVHSAAAHYIAHNEALTNALVIVSGATSIDGSSVATTASTLDLTDNSWSQASFSSGSVSARWGAVSAYDEEDSRLVVFGGRNGSGAGTALSSADYIDFSSGSAAVTTSTPANAWAGTFDASLSYDDEERRMLISGGRDSSGALVSGAMEVFWNTTGNTLKFVPLQSFTRNNAGLEGRAGAQMIMANGDRSYLVFGEDDAGVLDSIVEVGQSGAASGGHGPVLAYYDPTGGLAAASESGEQIVIHFNSATNMADLVADLNSSLSSYIRPAVRDGLGNVTQGTWPSISSIAVEDEFAISDKLIITLAGNSSDADSGAFALDFTPNAQNGNPIRSHGDAGRPYGGWVAVLGTTDHTKHYEWNGSSGSLFETGSNWSRGSAPGVGDVAIIPPGTPECVVTADPLTGPGLLAIGGSTSSPIQLNSLIVVGGLLQSNREIQLSSTGSFAPGLAVLRGYVGSGVGGDANITFSNSTSTGAILSAHGNLVTNSMSLSGAGNNFLRATGSVNLRENLTFSFGKVFGVYSDLSPATLRFFSGAASSLSGQVVEVEKLVVGKDAGTTLTSNTPDCRLHDLVVESGAFLAPSTVFSVRRSVQAQESTNFSIQGTVRATGPQVRLDVNGGTVKTITSQSLGTVSEPEFSVTGFPGAWTTSIGNWNSFPAGGFFFDAAAPPPIGTGEISQSNINAVQDPGTTRVAFGAWVRTDSGAGTDASFTLGVRAGGLEMGSVSVEGEDLIAGVWLPLYLEVEVGDANSDTSFEVYVRTQDVGTARVTGVRQLVLMEETSDLVSTSVNLVEASLVRTVTASSAVASRTTTMSSSMLRMEGAGSVNELLTTIPAGSAVRLEGTESSTFLVGIGPTSLSGALEASNVDVFTDSRSIGVQPGGLLRMKDSSLLYGSIRVDDPLSAVNASGIQLERVSFEGTGNTGSVSPNTDLTFISIGDQTHTLNSTNAFSVRHPTFDSNAGTPVSVEAATALQTANEYQILGAVRSAGGLGPESEVDPDGDALNPATTGNVLWKDAGTLRVAMNNPENTSITSGGADPVVLADMSLEADGVARFQTWKIALETTVDDTSANALTNIQAFAESNGVPGYQPTGDIRQVFAVTSILNDDPVIDITGSFTIVNSAQIYIVANLGSDFSDGDRIQLSILEVAAPLDVTFKAAIDPSLSTSEQLYTEDGDIIAGIKTVANLASPSIYAGGLAHGGSVIAAGDGILLQASGLDPVNGSISAITALSSGTPPTLSAATDAIISHDGRLVANVSFATTPDLDYRGLIQVTYTDGAGNHDFILNLLGPVNAGGIGSGDFSNQVVITAITPVEGDAPSQTVVVITGSGFADAGAVTLFFGTEQITNFTVDSDTQITATVGPGTPETNVDVTLTVELNGTVLLVDAFRYVTPHLELIFDGIAAPGGSFYQLVELDYETASRTLDLGLGVVFDTAATAFVTIIDQDAATQVTGDLIVSSAASEFSGAATTTMSGSLTTGAYTGLRRFIIVVDNEGTTPIGFTGTLSADNISSSRGSLVESAVRNPFVTTDLAKVGGAVDFIHDETSGAAKTLVTRFEVDLSGASGSIPLHFALGDDTATNSVTLRDVTTTPTDLGTFTGTGNSPTGQSIIITTGTLKTFEVEVDLAAGNQIAAWSVIFPSPFEITNLTGDGTELAELIVGSQIANGKSLQDFTIDFGATPRSVTLNLGLQPAGTTSFGAALIDVDAQATSTSPFRFSTASDSGETFNDSPALALSYTTPAYSGVHRFTIATEAQSSGSYTYIGTLASLDVLGTDAVIDAPFFSPATNEWVIASKAMAYYLLDDPAPTIQKNFATEVVVDYTNVSGSGAFQLAFDDVTGFDGIVVRDLTDPRAPKNLVIKTTNTPGVFAITPPTSALTTRRYKVQSAATQTIARRLEWNMIFPTGAVVQEVNGDGAGQGLATPVISISDVRDSAEGRPYFEVLTVQGGTPPYTWSLAGGSLPFGIILDPSTGTLYGGAREGTGRTQDYNVFFRVTDAFGNSDTKEFTMNIGFNTGWPVFTDSPNLPDARVGQPYSHQLQFSDPGTHSIQFGLGNPIQGINMRGQGEIFGTPAFGEEGYYFLLIEGFSPGDVAGSSVSGGIVIKLQVLQ